MAQHSTGYTIGFAAAVCIVCGLGVAGSAVALAERQAENKVLDRRKQVLSVAKLLPEGAPGKDEITKIYEANIKPEMIVLATGEEAKGIEAASFDQQRAAKDPKTSKAAPDNAAKVFRLPEHAQVFHVLKDGETDAYILPIEGYGLWSVLYGYLALDKDGTTIRGITFYQHGETPGLGGEVDNPNWKKSWPGRKAFDQSGKPVIRVIKGQAGPAESDPHRVDGLSGATITANGVTNLVQFWLSEQGFGPYLQRVAPKGRS